MSTKAFIGFATEGGFYRGLRLLYDGYPSEVLPWIARTTTTTALCGKIMAMGEREGAFWEGLGRGEDTPAIPCADQAGWVGVGPHELLTYPLLQEALGSGVDYSYVITPEGEVAVYEYLDLMERPRLLASYPAASSLVGPDDKLLGTTISLKLF